MQPTFSNHHDEDGGVVTVSGIVIENGAWIAPSCSEYDPSMKRHISWKVSLVSIRLFSPVLYTLALRQQARKKKLASVIQLYEKVSPINSSIALIVRSNEFRSRL